MAIIEGWLPPTREHWELIVYYWQYFPVLTAIQWLTDWYPQGKTSQSSRFNLPGKWAWFLMEIPGTLTVLYLFLSIPSTLSPPLTPWSLPIGNKTLLALYTTHYIYRAILSPLLLNPSMSPIHLLVYLSATAWQVMNGLSIGGWVGGYGPTTQEEWGGREAETFVGLVIMGWAFLGNVYHDDELREIRREVIRRRKQEGGSAEARNAAATKDGDGKTVDDDKSADNNSEPDAAKVYMIPKNGLFNLILYPHYLCEWIEWAGFYILAGRDCVPARTFLINEIATMLPRALGGWRWYVRTFGREKVGRRKAVIPFLM